MAKPLQNPRKADKIRRHRAFVLARRRATDAYYRRYPRASPDEVRAYILHEWEPEYAARERTQRLRQTQGENPQTQGDVAQTLQEADPCTKGGTGGITSACSTAGGRRGAAAPVYVDAPGTSIAAGARVTGCMEFVRACSTLLSAEVAGHLQTLMADIQFKEERLMGLLTADEYSDKTHFGTSTSTNGGGTTPCKVTTYESQQKRIGELVQSIQETTSIISGLHGEIVALNRRVAERERSMGIRKDKLTRALWEMQRELAQVQAFTPPRVQCGTRVECRHSEAKGIVITGPVQQSYIRGESLNHDLKYTVIITERKSGWEVGQGNSYRLEETLLGSWKVVE